MNIIQYWYKGKLQDRGSNCFLDVITNKFELIPKHIKMSDKNCFFFPSSSSKNNYVAKAMK
jgi:hypothetical protein